MFGLLLETGLLNLLIILSTLLLNLMVNKVISILISRYQQCVGKLNYLTITHLDITYTIDVLRQYMHAPHQSHNEAQALELSKECSRMRIVAQALTSLSVTVFSDAN